jgi:hypothetical protein
VVGHRQRVAVLTIAELELALESAHHKSLGVAPAERGVRWLDGAGAQRL